MSETLTQIMALYNAVDVKDAGCAPDGVMCNKFRWVNVDVTGEALRVSDEGAFFRVLLGYKSGVGEDFMGAAIVVDFDKVRGAPYISTIEREWGDMTIISSPTGAWRTVTVQANSALSSDLPPPLKELRPVEVPNQAEGVFEKMRLRIASACAYNSILN